ncbi:uncharacterized protein CIMG_12576 [Coccidioides immitis RS]|uniref:Histone H2A/H2B/H3 domain-containing protein n=1 Tax=Coccidioides immitis (strain RS) TaxID=246410 RepID=A0A0E1RUY1_COCIM|nr:uncharacterized protein CIMG_12576 [Coccidioides immitis RS]EAS27186.1 hypothetical protein CIMG_12576 [Coccidioides immitis RS]
MSVCTTNIYCNKINHIKRRISAPVPPFKIGKPALIYQKKTAEAILCTLFKCSVMAMMYHKHITVNANNIKLVLDISAKIRSNSFSSIDVSDHPISATTICCLCAAPAPPTTTATTPPPPLLPTTAFLPPSSTIRVSAHQMAGIRAPVWFTKLVLEEQEKKKKKKKK